MKIEGSIALVTGANRGIGKTFVEALLARGAAKVYAAARDVASLEGLFPQAAGRVVPLALDVADAAQVEAAAHAAPDVTLLINNAGVAGFSGALSAPNLDAARHEMEVNYFGTLNTTRAFRDAPALHGGGAVLNVLSFLSLATAPTAGTYSASKAAQQALTRTLRAELKARGALVVGVLPVQVDTDMGQALPEPRLTTQEVVDDSLDAVEAGIEEVFPGELSRNVAAQFAANPQAVQAHLSAKAHPID